MWPRIRTAIAVMLLSSVIWIFAEGHVTQTARVDVGVFLPPANPNDELMYQFLDEQNSGSERYAVVKAVMKGPASRIQKIKDEEQFKVTLSLDRIGYDPCDPEPQKLTVQLLDKLRDGPRINEIPIAEFIPATLSLRVTRLVKRELPIKVYSQRNNMELPQAKVQPSVVTALVPNQQFTEARITLSAEEQRRAQEEPIKVAFAVKLPDGREQPFSVMVHLPETASLWRDFQVKQPRLRYVMPQSMLSSRLRIELEDPRLATEPIKCRGSATALQAFENSTYHLLLEIQPDDKMNVWLDRPLRYNIPDQHDEFEITEGPRFLRFRIVEVEPEN